MKRVPETKRKNNVYPSVRLDSETNHLVQKALEKINTTIEMSLGTFQRLALKHFANRIIISDDIGLVFK